MSVTGPKIVADRLLPQLTTLLQSRKQARWQWKHCADENAHTWTKVIAILDARINKGESLLGDTLSITGFRMKREVIE